MNEVICIYMDLDCLMDTRLSVLFDMDPLIAEENLEKGYLSRHYDEFVGVETEKFKEAYAKRNKRILHKSVVTKAHEILLYFATQTVKAAVSSPFVRRPRLVLNVFPYKLEEDEIVMLIQAVKSLTKDRMDIEVIETPPEMVTPQYFKDSFACVVMYHYAEWLEIHSINGNLVKTQCPEISLIAPAIVKSKEAYAALKGVKIYESIELYTSLYFKLNLYPVSFFCADIERFKKKAN